MTDLEIATITAAYVKANGPSDEDTLTAYIKAIERMQIDGDLAQLILEGKLVGILMSNGQYAFKTIRQGG